jgi:hypothetical protein
MADLRQMLERESERVSLRPGAAERMFERGRRRERNRRAGALVIGTAILAGVLAIVWSGLGLPSDVTPTPVAPSPAPSLPGTYTTRLPADDEIVRRLGMNGEYTLGLSADGGLTLSGPREFDLPGEPVTFETAGQRFTTDLFVGSGCDAPGTFRWTAVDGSLRFIEVDDDCEQRVALLGSRPWSVLEPLASTPDPLQGDWTATFSCAEMVRAVREAPVPADFARFWLSAQSTERGSEDPEDPCAVDGGPISFTIRFDDGRILIFDRELDEGFDGTYKIEGETFILRDGGYRNIVGQYRVAFALVDDTVTFDLIGRGGTDPFFVATWESGVFTRS